MILAPPSLSFRFVLGDQGDLDNLEHITLRTRSELGLLRAIKRVRKERPGCGLRVEVLVNGQWIEWE
jgi:hypothetical protein